MFSNCFISDLSRIVDFLCGYQHAVEDHALCAIPQGEFAAVCAQLAVDATSLPEVRQYTTDNQVAM